MNQQINEPYTSHNHYLDAGSQFWQEGQGISQHLVPHTWQDFQMSSRQLRTPTDQLIRSRNRYVQNENNEMRLPTANR